MPFINLILITAAGAFCSMCLPFLLKFIGFPIKTDSIRNIKEFMGLLKATFTFRIIAMTVASLIVAVVIAAMVGDDIDSWNVALINGWCWQSFLARIAAPGT